MTCLISSVSFGSLLTFPGEVMKLLSNSNSQTVSNWWAVISSLMSIIIFLVLSVIRESLLLSHHANSLLFADSTPQWSDQWLWCCQQMLALSSCEATQSKVNSGQSMGLRTHPCGEPVFIITLLKVKFPIQTDCSLPVRKSNSQSQCGGSVQGWTVCLWVCEGGLY